MIPSDMKAAVYRGRGKVVVETVPVPAIGTGEVLVRIAACGVCHTDLKKVEYGLQAPPRIYGHEMAGTIVAIGKGVRGWKTGDRVAVFHHIPCGKCFYCDRADYAQCPVYKKTGSTAGFEPAGGGFAQYLRGAAVDREERHGARAPIGAPRARQLPGAREHVPQGGRSPQAPPRRSRPRLRPGPDRAPVHPAAEGAGARPVGLDLIASRRRLSARLGAAWSADPRSPSFERRLREETGGAAPTARCSPCRARRR
jgi:L-iditol 2-dehydrogenase